MISQKNGFKDIECVENVTKLESPFKKSEIYNTQLKLQSREHPFSIYH
jgi:hypothetical protein